jgi:H+/Cl- antiporter ClcA
MNDHTQESGWRIRIVFWIGAIVVGLTASAFALMAAYADEWFHAMRGEHAWLPWVTLPLGLGAIAWISKKWLPGVQGSGIPQTLAALECSHDSCHRDRLLSIKIALGKILFTVLAIGSGGSVGREGPTVHVGAAVMHSLGRWARFPAHFMERGLILAGGAAGLAAAFNTPLAGIVFAIEEMNRAYEQRTSGLVLTAVILAGLTAVAVHGQYHYFGQVTANLALTEYAGAILITGIVGGVFGGLFSQALIKGVARVAPYLNRYTFMVAAGCGLFIVTLAWVTDSPVFGTGYIEARAMIEGNTAVAPDLWYPIAKFLATVASYFSGVPGGIFAPSLATGAGLGADLAHFAPELAPAGALIALGMVAYFTGVVQAPITAFVIVMEMTGNHQLMLPLMATALLANHVSKMVCPDPLYRSLAMGFKAAD